MGDGMEDIEKAWLKDLAAGGRHREVVFRFWEMRLKDQMAEVGGFKMYQRLFGMVNLQLPLLRHHREKPLDKAFGSTRRPPKKMASTLSRDCNPVNYLWSRCHDPSQSSPGGVIWKSSTRLVIATDGPSPGITSRAAARATRASSQRRAR